MTYTINVTAEDIARCNRFNGTGLIAYSIKASVRSISALDVFMGTHACWCYYTIYGIIGSTVRSHSRPLSSFKTSTLAAPFPPSPSPLKSRRTNERKTKSLYLPTRRHDLPARKSRAPHRRTQRPNHRGTRRWGEEVL